MPVDPQAWQGARFRRSPLFALVPHGDLPADQRAAFQPLAGRADYFGLLMPDTALALSTKAVDPATARLLLALQQPGPLPAFACAAADPARQRGLVQLVLDGILEIETVDGFVSGPRALPWLPADAAPADGRDASTTPLQQLSLQALRLAAAQPALPPLALASRLYRFNTLPVHPAWLQRFGTASDARDALGLDARSAVRGLLFDHYDEIEHPAWHQWHLSAPGPAPALRYKLYVSLHPDALVPGTARAIECLVSARVPAFKLVRGSLGLLRPDKLVAYLDSRPRLLSLARRLRRVLRGCRAQGVPFSCAVGSDGLLSWGSDPPAGERLLDWQRVESWRSWITRRLAFAMVQARAGTDSAAQVCHFALDRLHLEGVDTEHWTPLTDVGPWPPAAALE